MMIEALKIIGGFLILAGGIGGFILIIYLAWSEIVRDKRYDKW